MAITISFGIQKGGVGKTTTTGITSWILSKDAKVLAVDFDSQGNLSALLTQKNVYDFTDNTVLEACKEQDPRPYIIPVTDTLHLLPAEDLLATFSRWIYREYKGDPAAVLKKTLDVVKEDYDYILIDCPPNLGDQTINALVASDYTVALLQSEPFCLDALARYMDVVENVVPQANSDIKIAGILTTLIDSRGATDTIIIREARKNYEAFVFNAIIKRRSKIKDFSLYGFSDQTKADRDALESYYEFVEELKQRVK